ncbi:unnamed protein product [Diatraea saccharalis]|uniref:Flavin-containing monooxygenase n=1 Tax=Diatraea saccharalis TaxID=40085 RepID=A0A9N9WF24_9NEOP|nr:unnamed protein product [Diatraea saccharalis]
MANRLRSCAFVLCFLSLALEVKNGFGLVKENPRACIIGAGYSGLGTARYMKEYGVNFTVFEATKHVGGTWRFDPHVGTDEDGLPLFTSMYKNLRINTPRLTMEYRGFPFPDDTQSFPTGECFHKYLKLFAKHFELEKQIEFQSYVTSIKWAEDHWNITYTKVDKKETRTAECDFVVVANGEFSTPVWPNFEGQDTFKGKMIHSHDYKDPDEYKNRRVLLVGAGPSGLDLAVHLANVTSKLVHSHHLNYNQPYFSNTYIKKPDIEMFTSNGVIFQDNSFEDVDDVIFCTGYVFSHPFLDKSVGITATEKFLLPLYQHMVNIRHPTMVFVGVPKKVLNSVLEAQGEYAAALAAGKFELPPQETMLKAWLKHVRTLHSKGIKILDVNVIGNEMDNYFVNLTQEAGIYRRPPVLTDIRDFNAKYRLDDLLNYRDFDFRIIDDYKYERWYNPRQGNPCPIDD